MTHTLEATYEGARLQLCYGQEPKVSLIINGIERETASSPSLPITLRVGSPVQTGYEQHEFIEAVIHYEANKVSATLHSGDLLIAEQECPIG
jgi:hypothetical protein